MDNQVVTGNLIGYYHFVAKDKSKIYYVIQLVRHQEDGLNNQKACVKDIFVDEECYKNIMQKKTIGDKLQAEIITNFNTDKIYYKVVI